MKLICDCGNIEEFVLPLNPDDSYLVEEHQHYTKKSKSDSSFNLNSGHDELFISCTKCGLSIHIFT